MDAEKKFICGSCGIRFKRSDNLKKHILNHTSIRSFQCSFCDKAFRERSHLSAHFLIHTGEKPYKCSYCDRAFNQNSNLKKHIMIHTDNRPYLCSVCNLRFTQQCYLKEHMKNHTGERGYECFQCGKKFKNSGHLKSHLKVHSNERPYVCSVCDKAFKYEKHYSSHLSTHDGEEPCYCVVCRKEFPCRSDLSIHMLVHKNMDVFECFVCSKAFRKFDDYKRHMQAHSGKRPYKCEECGDSFKSKTALKYHLMLHTNEKPFTCDVCGCGHRTKSHLKSHMISHGTKRHTCSICDKTFKYKCNHTRHMKAHVQKEDKICISASMLSSSSSYKEETCTSPKVRLSTFNNNSPSLVHYVKEKNQTGTIPSVNEEILGKGDKSITVISFGSPKDDNLVSSTRARLEENMNRYECKMAPSIKICTRNHSEKEPNTCIIFHKTPERELKSCDQVQFLVAEPSSKSNSNKKSIFNSGSLDGKEIEDLHDIKREEGQCKICNKIFFNKALLKQHMLVHSVDRPYECPICKKRFRYKTALRTHSKSHTVRKLFSCNVCDKKFIQSSDLKRHMKTHTKFQVLEKPFICEFCGLKFTYRYNLDIHKVIHFVKKDTQLYEEKDENFPSKNVLHSIMNRFAIQDFVPELKSEKFLAYSDTGERNSNDISIDSLRSLTQENIDFDILGGTITEEPSLGSENITSSNAHLCFICSKDFGSKSSFKAHMKTHDLSSDLCSKYLNSLSKLKHDMITHTEEHSFGCSFCERIFAENDHLETHMAQVHHGECQHEHCNCFKKFSLKSHHSRHLISHKTENESYDSGHIGKLTEVTTHQLEGSEKKLVSSNRLSNDLLQVPDCNINNEQCHQVGENADAVMHKCTICEKHFKKKSNLKRHFLSHSGMRPYSCSYCEKSFKEKKCRDEHELTHTGIRPHICMICDKRFTQKSVLVRHMKIHDNINVTHDNKFDTHYCGIESYVDDQNCGIISVLESQKEENSKEEILEIDDDILELVAEVQLGKISVQAIPYEAAMKRKQLLRENKRLMCPVCFKIFKRKGNLVRHMQTHELLKCSICKKAFQTKEDLDDHMLAHNPVLLYKCELCSDTFNASKDFEAHSKLHEQENLQQTSTDEDNTVSFVNSTCSYIPPLQDFDQNLCDKDDLFVCPICGMHFKFKHGLERHKLIHNMQKNITQEKNPHHCIIVSSAGTSEKNLVKKRNVRLSVNSICKSKKILHKEAFEADITGELELGKITVKTIPYSIARERVIMSSKCKS
ncbi:hypothetical protein SK128_007941, partial [Halocaridina rubra]